MLPNKQDGVPYLTTPPIKPHSTFTYEFPITHHGTYWYHSHVGLQEQQGMYGPLVFHSGKKKHSYSADHTIILSDWTNENPYDVFSNIRRDGDYYARKKDSVLSWMGMLHNGWPAIKNRITSAWQRMPPMDISDIGYDAFLANGKRETIFTAKPKTTILARLINAAASSYFNVEFAGGPMTIIAADGVDVTPIKVKRLQIAIAETYDVLITIPDEKLYDLRATAEDGTGHSSIFIGSGNKKVNVPSITRPNLYLPQHMHHKSHKKNKNTMNHSTHVHHRKQANHHQHKAQIGKVIAHMTNYNALQATQTTALPTKATQQTFTLRLTGNMERYVWSFNDKVLSKTDAILIEKGANIRFVMINETMMHHPIHLHGHFFRVLNKYGKYSPLKHTVNVPSMDTVTIEFAATEDKDWFFHCHNLYHMKSGMSRVISYKNSTRYTPAIRRKLAHDAQWYSARELNILSQMFIGKIRSSNSYHAFELELEHNYNKETEVETLYKFSQTRYLDFYAGINVKKEKHRATSDVTGVVGISYVLPMLLELDLRFDTKQKARLGLGSKHQLAKYLSLEWHINTEHEYRIMASWEVVKGFSLSASYDSDYHAGAGASITF